MNQHSPEPWTVSMRDASYGCRVLDANGEFIADNSDMLYLMFSNGDIRRIVACVNACAGIPTEELERHGIDAVLPKDNTP